MAVNLNGDMSQWTWGTEFLSCAHSQIAADCFRYGDTTGAVHHVRRSTDVPGIMDCGRIIPYSLEIEVAAAQPSPAANTIGGMVYRGEGSEWAPLHKRPVALRFWLKSDVAGVFHAGLANGPENLYHLSPVEVGVTGVWMPAEINIPPAPGEWWTDHRIGYSMPFFWACGTDFHGVAGAWGEGAKGGGSNQVNFNAVAGKKLRLAGFRLRHAEDERPDEFEMPEATELACMRYTQKSFARGTKPQSNLTWGTGEQTWKAINAGANVQSTAVRLGVPMRKAPTMTAYAVGGIGSQARALLAGACTGTTFDELTETSFRLSATAPAGTAVNETIGVHWVADANLPAPNGGSGA